MKTFPSPHYLTCPKESLYLERFSDCHLQQCPFVHLRVVEGWKWALEILVEDNTLCTQSVISGCMKPSCTLWICTYLPLPHSHTCTVFNVGEYRRKAVGASKSYDFFHPNNQEGQRQRRWVSHRVTTVHASRAFVGVSHEFLKATIDVHVYSLDVDKI